MSPKLFFRQSRAGFGMIELLMAAAVMAGMVYTATTLVGNLSKASKRVEGSGDFHSLFNSVNQILGKTTVCTDALRNIGATNQFPGGIGVLQPVTIYSPSPVSTAILDPVTGKNMFPNLIVKKFNLEKLKSTGGDGWSARLTLEVVRRELPDLPMRKEFFMNVGINPVAPFNITTCEAGIEKTTIQAAACGGFSANYDQNASGGADVCSFKSGSAAAPSVKFSFGGSAPFTHDVDTGLFSPAQDSVGITAGGRESFMVANGSAASASFRGRVLTNYTSASAVGNARGPASVDLQIYRENADEVASGWFSTLTGGYKNKAPGHYGFVGGGSYQFAIGDNSVAVGGWSNTAQGVRAAILGGYGNTINDGFIYEDAVIVGGWRNTISGGYSFIGAGGRNVISGRFSAIVAGGDNDTGWGMGFNEIRTKNAFIGAGGSNYILAGDGASITAGYSNRIDTTGGYAHIGGGMLNRIRSVSGGTIAGEGLWVDGYSQVAVGRYNVVPNSAGSSSVVDTDLLFIVGNGRRQGWPNPDIRSNAFTIDGLGNTWAAGNVTANSFTATSDVRLKERIAPLESMWEKIMRLKPVSYFWRDEKLNQNGRSLGFIAQEVEKELPELVRTDAKGMKSINYAGMVAPLTKAVQEQQEIISEQQRQIAAQQREIDEMKELLCSIKKDAKICHRK